MGTPFKPPVPLFLTPQEKADWSAKKYPFTIVGIKSGDGKYGPGHTYELRRVVDKTGEVITRFVTFKSNFRRDEEAQWIKDKLVEDGSGIGPCVLVQVDTDQINPAWAFEAAE